MAYQSLYRKYRPQRFGELIGQEHVVGALRNAVREGRVAHAYFFSGPRGTGKTTTARILAKALNCTSLGADGEPCGECTACSEITVGSSLDVVEIDAASNNGVDEIRDLIERVAYRSAAGGKKVYIVDEVHELSGRASNALLKTLEEPPDHVVFVLATTNPEKVLPTIRSRTQPFEFTLLTTKQLVGHLADVAASEGVEADPEALAIVARRATGSVRDALSLLDQALAESPSRLTTEQVAEVFGGTPFEQTLAILRAVAAEDVAGVLVGLSALFEAGHDPRRVTDDLLRALRDALLVTAAAGRVRIAAPEEEQTMLAELGDTMGTGAIVRGLETLGQAVVDMRGVGAPDPRLVLEVALARCTRRDAGSSAQALADRVERLERAVDSLRSGAAPPAPTPSAAPRAPTAPTRTIGAVRKSASTAEASAAAEPVEPAAESIEPAEDLMEAAEPAAPIEPIEAGEAIEPASPVALDDVIVAWAAILPSLPMATRSAVQEAQPVAIEGDVVVFGMSPGLLEAAKPRFQREAAAIRAALVDRVGRTVRFRLVPYDFARGSGAPPSGTTRDASLRPVTGASSDAPSEPPDIDLVDPDELVDAPRGSGALDSVSRLVQTFGASVVEERPRE